MQPVKSLIPAEIVGLRFTNIERFIMECLSDGKAHTLISLKGFDEHASDVTVQNHIKLMRKKLEISNFRIWAGTEKGGLVYRLVRILNS